MAFVISIASGTLILLQGTLHVIRTQWGLELGIGELRRHALRSIDYKVIGIVSVVLGIMVVLGALLIHRPEKHREGGITVIAFSVLSILAGGGFLAGTILGVIGGALALSHFSTEQQPKSEQALTRTEHPKIAFYNEFRRNG
jgi:hypothetical protein